MTPLVYRMPRGTAQIDDVSTWLPPSLHTPWQNVFFEYINIIGVCTFTGYVRNMLSLVDKVHIGHVLVSAQSFKFIKKRF